VTSGSSPEDALVSWFWDGDGYGNPPHDPCSDDGYTPNGQPQCDEAINPQAVVPIEIPWFWEEPISGTVPALSTTHVDILFTSVVTDPLPLGTYTATLIIAENDAVAQIPPLPVTMHVVSEYITPTANFDSNSPACPGKEVIFSNTTAQGIPADTTYLWDFGDGTTSTEENPIHLFAAFGKYNVTLTACNIEGMCDSFSSQVEMVGLPEANFTYQSSGLDMSFTNLSLYASDFNWSFGDGTNSIEVNPLHHYAERTAYTVTLAAISACGSDEYEVEVRAGSFIYLPVISKTNQP
jgi:hypothetical protein